MEFSTVLPCHPPSTQATNRPWVEKEASFPRGWTSGSAGEETKPEVASNSPSHQQRHVRNTESESPSTLHPLAAFKDHSIIGNCTMSASAGSEASHTQNDGVHTPSGFRLNRAGTVTTALCPSPPTCLGPLAFSSLRTLSFLLSFVEK